MAGFEDEEDESNSNESNTAPVTEHLDVNRANGAVWGLVLMMDNNNRLSMTETEWSVSQGIEIVKDNGSRSVGSANSKRRVATPLPPLVSAPHQSEAGSSNGDGSAIDSQD